VNILTKNTAVPLIGILLYAAIGFNLMYPTKADGKFVADGNTFQFGQWLAFAGVGVGTDATGVTPAYNAGYTYWTDFLFQAMFAATCATIVSGAVAERIKLWSFMIFTVFFVGITYPWLGSWKWGGGWLQQLETPFYDFAGSTLVHAVGGFGALAGVLLLGPRIGKYRSDGSVNPIPGHSMPLATIGVFLLFLGWFGFNGGSVLSADPGLVSLVLVTTAIAASAGGLAALVTSQLVNGKPDLSMTLNGVLAGLVGITAGADKMLPLTATIIGLVAGVIVVLSVITLDKLKLDDPVGAISVHLVCGVWGTLAVGIFGELAGTAQLVSQAIGIAAIGAGAFVSALIIFGILKATVGIRVSETEEIEGLDIGEHGMEAYHGVGSATAFDSK
jgi:Amt family ammonium transporter